MNDMAVDVKAQTINEVLAITEMLRDYHQKISSLPRSITAARQLAVIIARLDGWYQAFALSQSNSKEPQKEEILRELTGVIEEYLDRKLS